MTGGKLIDLSGLTFIALLLTFAVWTFSNMGDCAQGTTCPRPGWIDPLIFIVGAALWLLGARAILRRKKT